MAAPGQSWITRLLRLERDGETFIAKPQRGRSARLFGGLIAAQALHAAGATVDAPKRPQSLHLYFVRGDRHDVDIALRVERTRTGRSFDTRRATATQNGDVILELIASFHLSEPGADWHPATGPGLALEDATVKHPAVDFADRFEIRTSPEDSSPYAVPPYWIRMCEPIEADPLMRACTLTLMSDLGPVPAARPPGMSVRFDEGFATSLDHSLWFHRPFEPDEWHYYDVRAVNNSDSRGLVVGSLYDAAGTLIASMTQEALWRM